MPKQRIRLVEESDTIYEIDENCVKRRKRAQKLTEREKKRNRQYRESQKPS